MAIPNKQIGWSNESNLLWQIAKLIDSLKKITSSANKANTSGAGATTPYKLIAAASTNANIVKASSGTLYSIVAIGLADDVRYLKIYDSAVSPTIGTDVPVMTIPVPTNTAGAGVSIPFPLGVQLSSGISIGITSGVEDTDTGIIDAGDVILNITFA